MALEVDVNPQGLDDKYLRCLNTSFPHWGEEYVFKWAFCRALPPDPLPDRFLLREEGNLLAGSAVSYRTLSLPNGSAIRVGIMTGSWTLEAARGRGCFSRVIQESIRITREREGALLLAFVTHDNPSCRQLQRAGAAMFPTSYLIANPEDTSEIADSVAEIGDADLKRAVDHWAGAKKDQSSFRYSSFETWKSQFVDRPWETKVVGDASGAFAVIERHAETDRINALGAPSKAREIAFLHDLRTRASLEGRKLFAFSTDGELAAGWRNRGLIEKPGFLTAIVTDSRRLGDALGVVGSSGDSLENQLLADCSGQWSLGRWNLQSGDRM